MESNYKSFARRIKAASKDELSNLDRSLDRLFEAGLFTISEYQILDQKIIEAGL